MRLTQMSKCPRIVHVANFLTAAEAAEIISLAQNADWLRSSAEASTSEADAEEADNRAVRGRTNKWCCVGSEHTVLRRAVERACWLSGLTPEHAEDVQVVHYKAGQQYQYHLDHYTSRDVQSASDLSASGGNRLVSCFVYLNDCASGGHTHFPNAGVRVAPVCGHALLWHSIDRKGLLDARTLHAGLPVEGCATKWGMNIWLRQRPRVAQQPSEPGVLIDEAPAAAAGETAGGGSTWMRAPAPPLTATTPKARETESLRERTC